LEFIEEPNFDEQCQLSSDPLYISNQMMIVDHILANKDTAAEDAVVVRSQEQNKASEKNL